MNQNDSKVLTHIVAIGASAGGLVALEEFFKTVPEDTGLAFVVIQHLPPDHKSMMVELLSKHTELPVFYIEEGMEVEANCIYLIPPGSNISIFHGKFLLSPGKHAKRLNLPIDMFFRSLAEDQEEKAIAVILSGTGSDGSRGIRHIKENFGIVIAQDDSTAQFDGMPRSAIETGLTDFILPPEKMIYQILSYIQHPFARKTDSPPKIIADETGLTRIFSLLREKHMVDFTFYKQATVLRRIERRMTINQMHELQDYIKFLESYPKEISTLYNELLIGVTSFFRDQEAFDFLREQVLPGLLAEREAEELRFWVEGCSTGEEAYSLAIQCLECMETLGKSLSVKIFATDVDKNAVLYASDGVYPESISADLTPKQLAQYFNHRENHFQIARRVREMVVFAQHNLIKDPPFTKIDLVSCRNLLIYLQPVLQKRALEKFSFALNPQGVLFLGTSESIGEMTYYFEPLNHKWKIYRSKGKRIHLPGAPDRYYPNKHHPLGPAPARQRFTRSLAHERNQERLLQAVSDRYVSLTILVNEDNEVLHVLGETDKFLRFPSGKPVNNIYKLLVKEMVVPVTAGLQKVFKDKVPVKYSNIHIKSEGSVLTAKMEIHPLPEKADEPILAAIFVEDIEEKPKLPDDDVAEIDLHVERRIENLENELQFTRESLQTTIEELETSNEELGATNEELMASNEELQSTNEELQSVNQELYTVNAEYQGKNLELAETKNDLENLFNNLQTPVLFLDEHLSIRQFTPQASRLFKIVEKDIGRPIDHIAHEFVGVNLAEIFQEVIESDRHVEREIRTQSGEWYLMKVDPYWISRDFSSGVVVILIDVSRKRANEFKLRRLATVVLDANDAITVQDFDGSITAWNRAAENMYGFSEPEALSMNVRDLMPTDAAPGNGLDYLKKIQAGKEVKSFRTRRVTKQGELIDVYLTVTKLTDESGKPVAVATTERNVTGMPSDAC